MKLVDFAVPAGGVVNYFSTPGGALVDISVSAHQPVRIEVHDMSQDKLFDGFIEMRFVVTPELDGKQLQFRHKRSHIAPPEWSDWKPVPTIIMNKKIEEPTCKPSKTS